MPDLYQMVSTTMSRPERSWSSREMYLSKTTALRLAHCVKTVIKISSTDSVFWKLATLRWIIQKDHNLLLDLPIRFS